MPFRTSFSEASGTRLHKCCQLIPIAHNYLAIRRATLMLTVVAADYDGAWKELLDVYFQPFLEFCFQDAAHRVDWAQPVEFLDQELQEVVRDAELGKLRADKLNTSTLHAAQRADRA